MSEAREELLHLIAGLPDDQVDVVLADVRRRAVLRGPRAARPFPWIGMIDDPSIPADLSENLDAYLEDFGASSL